MVIARNASLSIPRAIPRNNRLSRNGSGHNSVSIAGELHVSIVQ